LNKNIEQILSLNEKSLEFEIFGFGSSGLKIYSMDKNSGF